MKKKLPSFSLHIKRSLSFSKKIAINLLAYWILHGMLWRVYHSKFTVHTHSSINAFILSMNRIWCDLNRFMLVNEILLRRLKLQKWKLTFHTNNLYIARNAIKKLFEILQLKQKNQMTFYAKVRCTKNWCNYPDTSFLEE